jgi:prepilin-type processing-associated H-X9-DG protein
MPIETFPDPARTPTFVDEMNEADAYARAHPGEYFVNDYAFIWLDIVTDRHFGHGNVAFLDGHVEPVEEIARWWSYHRKDDPDKLYFQYPLKYRELGPWY